MRTSQVLFYCLLLTVFISSCASYVPVQKTLAPEIILPEETADFLFVNRFKPEDLEYNNENKVEVFEIGLDHYIKGLKSSFDTCRHLSLILSDTIIPSHSAHEAAYNLSVRVVNVLANTYEFDYIFSLDNYRLYFDQEVEVQENDEGYKSKTAYYDLVLNTYITIYASDGKVIDKLKEERRIFHDQRGVLSGLLAVGPSMGKADENVIKISDELGRLFITKFYPTSISEKRLFYGKKEFAPAYKAFRTRNWEIVERELFQLAKHPDNKIQGRAAYNLAVFYENRGQIAEMEYWYRRAEEKLGSLPNDPFKDIFNTY